MRSSFWSLFFLLSFAIILSVQSVCFLCDHKCKVGYVRVRHYCRRRVGRDVQPEECIGGNEIFIDDDILRNDEPVSIRCPEGKVLNKNMNCEDEDSEEKSGSWETHRYDVGDKSVLLEVKRSDISVKVRSVNVDSNQK